jgi:peptidoglycan/LPS O-acetylase OafA/YrhL
LLRKGPEHVPRSWLVLLLAVGLMVLSVFCANVLVPSTGERDYFVIYTSSLVGLLIYSGVLFVTGYGRRLLPVLSAIIACGSILTLLFVAEYVMLQPFLGVRIASILATLIIFWSVPVEGHIIARAIQQHWFAGIAIAMVVFIMQVAFQQMLSADT